MKVALAVESMRRHTTDEGWQIMAGLRHAGYKLAGLGLDIDTRDVAKILEHKPDTIVVQDKREWEGKTAGGLAGFDLREQYTNAHWLAWFNRAECFVGTVLKDAQNDTEYNRRFYQEIGCQFWIVYYDKETVNRLQPAVPVDRMVRTYHTVDADAVPEYSDDRKGCIVSGALSGCYPLRKRLYNDVHKLPETHYHPHPGYGRGGCCTPEYLQLLSKFKVAVCTASTYGYALRKIIEATACGCRVITDLPKTDVLPFIDGNLMRVNSDASVELIDACIRANFNCYDPIVQAKFADTAKQHYDYRAMGLKLATDVEKLRCKEDLST